MNLMIVDDNPSMRQMIREFCSPYFEQIDECSNGKEAFESFSTHIHQYVIMDINMPVMNGLDALKMISGVYPDTRIIMITEYKEKEFETEALKSGAFRFLLKDNLYELETMLPKTE